MYLSEEQVKINKEEKNKPLSDKHLQIAYQENFIILSIQHLSVIVIVGFFHLAQKMISFDLCIAVKLWP